MIYASVVFQELMSVCCNVLLQGVVAWEDSGFCFALVHHYHHHHLICAITTTQLMNSHIVCVFELSRYSSYVHDNTFIFPVVMFKGITAVYYNDETLGPRPGAVNCCTHLLMGKYGVFLLADQGKTKPCRFRDWVYK